MSETETKCPPPHALAAMDNGLARYRPALTALYVDALPDGRRRIEVDDDGRKVIFDLSPDLAKHLAGLLHSEAAVPAGEARHG